MPPIDPPSDLVIVCASPDDRRWLLALRRHLVAFRSSRALDLWERGDVRPGDSWEVAQRAAWEGARAALLLVSPQLLAEDLAPGGETSRQIGAMQARGAPVLWLATSYSAYRHTQLAALEPLSDPERPLDGLGEAEVQRVLVKACEQLLAALPAESPPPAAAPGSAARAPTPLSPERRRHLMLGLGLGVMGLFGASALAWSRCSVDALGQDDRAAQSEPREPAQYARESTRTTPSDAPRSPPGNVATASSKSCESVWGEEDGACARRPITPAAELEAPEG